MKTTTRLIGSVFGIAKMAASPGRVR